MSLARDIADLGSVTSRLDTVGASEGVLSNRNMVINGAMQVAQRSSSETGLGASAGYFTCDRWRMGVVTSGRLTMSQSSDSPDEFGNSLKLECTTADTSIAAGEYMLIQHLIEGQDLQRIAKGTSSAKKITVSFYVKGNGNATYMCELWDNDNSRHNTQQFSVTSSWNRIVLTFDSDTTGALDDDSNLSLYLNFWLHAGSTFGGGSYTANTWASNVNANRAVGASSFFSSTSNTFQITGIQMEVGDTVTDFEHRLVADELERCKRYFQCSATSMNGGDRGASTQTDEMYFGKGESYLSLFFNPAMRAAPTVTTSSDTGTGAGRYTIAGVNNYTDGTAVKITQNFYSMLTPSTNASYSTKTGFDADAEL